MKQLWILLACIGGAVALDDPVRASSETDGAVTLATLLDEMVDRARLAQLPDPPYTCRQFSSYDRRSTTPGGEGWFANLDNKSYLRTETRRGRTEHVLMDATGPGAIVRFWVTAVGPGHGNGTLRVFLDGKKTPVIEDEVFRIISGGVLALPPLSESVPQSAEEAERGHNLYLPIPYAKSCEVTFEPVDDRPFFYQINYRTYVDGTRVETFSLERLRSVTRQLRNVESTLTTSGESSQLASSERSLESRLAAGTKRSVTLQGPAAIRQIRLHLDAADVEQALRSTVVQLDFDGKRTVWCPVGDLFGTGHQVHAHRTWYTRVVPDGTLTCWWVMPFQREAKLTLENLGDQDVEVTGGVRAGPWSWSDRSLYFHCGWRELHQKVTSPGVGEDVNFVSVEGAGVFVGDALSVFNGTDGWGWWGEGDEKIYVDGEEFPSHFGTGTEDYYGYAWAREEAFQSAFHAQPCGAGNKFGGFAVNSRFRGLDAIPFRESFRFDMELWHHRRTGIHYAPTTFWYGRFGAMANRGPEPEAASRAVAKKREDVWKVFRVKGALEGEDLKITARTGGVTELQNGYPPRWSSEKQIWWRDGAVGDRLGFVFPAEVDGAHRVFAALTRARDYGIVKARVNGRPGAGVIDRYSPELGCEEVLLGTFELRKGENPVEFEVVGANEKAIQRRMFGLDYLRIEKE